MKNIFRTTHGVLKQTSSTYLIPDVNQELCVANVHKTQHEIEHKPDAVRFVTV